MAYSNDYQTFLKRGTIYRSEYSADYPMPVLFKRKFVILCLFVCFLINDPLIHNFIFALSNRRKSCFENLILLKEEIHIPF